MHFRKIWVERDNKNILVVNNTQIMFTVIIRNPNNDRDVITKKTTICTRCKTCIIERKRIVYNRMVRYSKQIQH